METTTVWSATGRGWPGVLLVVALGASAGAGAAQEAAPEGHDAVARAVEALERCGAAAESGDEPAAESAARAAERAAASLPDSRSADALVIRARIRTGCRIPFAGLMRRGALVRNAIEQAVVLAEGDVIAAADLPEPVTDRDGPLRPAEAAVAGLDYADARERARRAFDRAFLSAALERHDGNITRTAESLGLHRQSLQRLLKQAGLREGEGDDG